MEDKETNLDLPPSLEDWMPFGAAVLASSVTHNRRPPSVTSYSRLNDRRRGRSPASEEGERSVKRAKLMWKDELAKIFVLVIRSLGIKEFPRVVLERMVLHEGFNEASQGFTLETSHIVSRLGKYWKNTSNELSSSDATHASSSFGQNFPANDKEDESSDAQNLLQLFPTINEEDESLDVEMLPLFPTNVEEELFPMGFSGAKPRQLFPSDNNEEDVSADMNRLHLFRTKPSGVRSLELFPSDNEEDGSSLLNHLHISPMKFSGVRFT